MPSDGEKAGDRDRDALSELAGVWSQDGESASVRFTAKWRGEPVHVSFDGPTAASASGEEQPVTMAVTSRPLKADFAGFVSGQSGPRLKGRLSAATVDGVDFARWLGAPLPIPGRLDSVSLDGLLDAGMREAALADARVTLNGDVYEGALALRLDGERPLLSATLATPTADLSDQLGGLLPRRAPDDSWSRERFDLARASAFDLDLRISANALTFNRLAFERAAFSVLLRGPRFEFALSEAHVGPGSLKGKLVLVTTPAASS